MASAPRPVVSSRSQSSTSSASSWVKEDDMALDMPASHNDPEWLEPFLPGKEMVRISRMCMGLSVRSEINPLSHTYNIEPLPYIDYSQLTLLLRLCSAYMSRDWLKRFERLFRTRNNYYQAFAYYQSRYVSLSDATAHHGLLAADRAAIPTLVPSPTSADRAANVRQAFRDRDARLADNDRACARALDVMRALYRQLQRAKYTRDVAVVRLAQVKDAICSLDLKRLVMLSRRIRYAAHFAEAGVAVSDVTVEMIQNLDATRLEPMALYLDYPEPEARSKGRKDTMDAFISEQEKKEEGREKEKGKETEKQTEKEKEKKANSSALFEDPRHMFCGGQEPSH
ncbi:MAG: hypothetical protein M1819_002079 [Sarea resinae]|nr:MAG: hypothetical protein M1819_002079 [Sarea resinae]